MSPSNFFMTNPEAMQLATETGGQSVVQGMNLFFEDLAKGRISSTDEQAYEVGKNLATTPGAVIFENELMQVIQYAPATKTVHERPHAHDPALHQQILYPRPATGQLACSLSRRAGAHRFHGLLA